MFPHKPLDIPDLNLDPYQAQFTLRVLAGHYICSLYLTNIHIPHHWGWSAGVLVHQQHLGDQEVRDRIGLGVGGHLVIKKLIFRFFILISCEGMEDSDANNWKTLCKIFLGEELT